MKSKEKFREIIFYKDYFEKFFIEQREKVKEKIIWTFELLEDIPKIPETYLKHIENTEGIYEIRVQQGGDIFRIFCFFDKGKIVVIANTYQKKAQKTLTKEISKAIKIKNEYENEQNR